MLTVIKTTLISVGWVVVKNVLGKMRKETQPGINSMVTPCINNIQHFNFQMMHITLKNVELLEHFKISKTAPTCLGLQGNHHQGATIST